MVVLVVVDDLIRQGDHSSFLASLGGQQLLVLLVHLEVLLMILKELQDLEVVLLLAVLQVSLIVHQDLEELLQVRLVHLDLLNLLTKLLN